MARYGLEMVTPNPRPTLDPSPDECDHWSGNPDDGACGCEAKHWYIVSYGEGGPFLRARCEFHSTPYFQIGLTGIVEISRDQWQDAEAMIQVHRA